ncbi:von Willebrand factor type A domain protein [Mycobacterium ulcerans str. Harvey]|uniref:von Willebrand factor type A domain protein n=1 Tax=Mycobacterium ulcerans str. Harvey TaxID=1299332 RepID=A0ABP3A3F8_MYCUL|nr:von Willebrand factor type A domain protein [Mycobacterium ulcerans str. Harvey]
MTEASDRHRYRAVEHLARVEARGDTEMLAPLRRALALLGREQVADTDDAVLILISDGQVGNEDQLLQELSGDLGRVRLHTIGVDEAVNAGFLRRLAGVGGGRCVLVDNEDRLDEALPGVIQRCARTPLATGLEVRAAGSRLSRTP